jgi:hypothetical protein
MRRQIAIRNPNLSAARLCKVFDMHRIPIPQKWEQELGVTTWVEAYKTAKGKNRIDKIISTDRSTAKW